MCIKFFNEESNKQDIMLFGGGHHANAFINYFSLEDSISFVIDDDPNKQTVLMPKSKLSIKSSKILSTIKNGLCVFSLMPEHEEKVIARNNSLAENKWIISSIFPSSKYSFLKENYIL